MLFESENYLDMSPKSSKNIKTTKTNESFNDAAEIFKQIFVHLSLILPKYPFLNIQTLFF